MQPNQVPEQGMESRRGPTGSTSLELSNCTAPSPSVKAIPIIETLTTLLEDTTQAEKYAIRPNDYPDQDSQDSARNFVAYLALRRKDLREIQQELHKLGISSLGRCETHVRDSVQRVLQLTSHLRGVPEPPSDAKSIDYERGKRILRDRTTNLLGPEPQQHSDRIMVTMPSEAAKDYNLVRNLVAAGMNVMRINFAHDDPEKWGAMIENLKRANSELGQNCRVMCDLAGPKLRTGPMEETQGVVRWNAFKDDYGAVIEPALVWLSAGKPAPKFTDASLPVNQEFLQKLRTGDEIHFKDHQSRTRWLIVRDVTNDGVWAEGARGAFMTTGITLTHYRHGLDQLVTGQVGELPPVPQRIPLKVDDKLILTRDDITGKLGHYDLNGQLIRPAQIGCSLTEAFTDAHPGQRIYFDDGKIAGIIEDVRSSEIHVRITWTRSSNATLTEEKGINLPDTDLFLPSIPPKDLEDLKFISKYASDIAIIGKSFVRNSEDVEALLKELDNLGLKNIGVVVKIETRSGFDNLPGILLTGLKHNLFGIMIARGDLGVEVGFERMAELQEEIFSLCAAAHVPTIWATQVLETLAKKGVPSRAEVSDVVMGARTQCVMLNKGPHIIAAVKFLGDVMTRMQGHQDRDFKLLRQLRVAGSLP